MRPQSNSPSDLAEIERLVAARAHREGFDPRSPQAASALAALTLDEVRRWNLGFKRGERSRSLTDPDAVIESVRRNLLGYGPLEGLLRDPDVWEIMVNSPEAIFVKRHRGPGARQEATFTDDEHVRRTLTRILDDASESHRKLDPSEGLQDAQLDDGARLHLVHGDIGWGGHLIFNIRKFTGIAFGTLNDLVTAGTLSREVADFLRCAVSARLSILFAGAPGSGKTTLLGCCAAQLDPALRIVTAEEVFELDIGLPNVAAMQTRPARAERAAVDLRRLVAGFLRMAPDVAIVGEVRDREAVPLLLTLSSGVTGYATIHASSAAQALSRMRLMCQISPDMAAMPFAAITELVAQSIDVVVHLRRESAGVQVCEVIAVEEPTNSGDSAQFRSTALFAAVGVDGRLRATGELPQRSRKRLEAAGFDMERLGADAMCGSGANL